VPARAFDLHQIAGAGAVAAARMIGFVAKSGVPVMSRKLILTSYALLLVALFLTIALAEFLNPIAQEKIYLLSSDGIKTVLGALVGFLSASGHRDRQ
jgi:hypothetical protein